MNSMLLETVEWLFLLIALSRMILSSAFLAVCGLSHKK
jgi:hypothetical protein